MLWGGRFSGKTDDIMEEFNASLPFDRIMASHDIVGSQAYAEAICQKGIITAEERDQLIEGLEKVKKEWEAKEFKEKPGDEDIHTANERRLTELIGPVAGKLHTGRSRNDQVATDTRLWLRDEAKKILGFLKELISVAVQRAEKEIDYIMPGYTHLQRAQPIRWSHLLLMYAWMWQADAQRLEQLMSRINQCPLGSGALAGNPFQIDREFLCQKLGFEGVMPNSLYGVSDRDFVAEFLFWGTLTMNHISKWAEDLIIYSSAEFGYVALADAYSTGSSLMPQKKNPDSLELLRGKAGRTFGQCAGFLMTLKGLCSTYNKDMQEDKEPLFDAVKTLSGCLQISSGVLSTMTVRPEKLKAALSYDMLATDLAEYLVRKGVPFRETHHVAGAAVKKAEEKKCQLNELTLEELQTLHPSFEGNVMEVWDYERSIENRSSIGGTSRSSVTKQIEQLKAWLQK